MTCAWLFKAQHRARLKAKAGVSSCFAPTTRDAFVVFDNTHMCQGVVTKFVEENEIETLNVASPRLSVWNEGYRFALDVIGGVVRDGVERELP